MVKQNRFQLAAVAGLLFWFVTPPATLGQSVLSGLWRVTAPRPTGSSPVGTLSLRLVDGSRGDPFHPDRGARELLVRFWYPAAPSQACKVGEYQSPKAWAYIAQIAGFPLPVVTTNSCMDAPVEAAVHPVIVFTHGYTGMLTDSTFIFEDLASRGYIVASIAHTYESTAIEFPDGRLITSLLGSYLAENTLRTDYVSLQLARSIRLQDVRYMVDELRRLNFAKDNPFSGRFDLSRLGVMGHSLGGEVAVASLERDARIRAAASLDGAISSELKLGTGKPVLLLAASRDEWSREECELWAALRGPRLAVNLIGADHFTPSDTLWLFPTMPGLAASVGGMGREKTIAAIRTFVAGFFDSHLLGKPQAALMSAWSSRYPDAIVTNQSQELCRGNTATTTGGFQ
jgi:dienelactone hydrolase